MHKLDRSAAPVPTCLQTPPEGWTYSDLRGNDKDEIRSALLTIQGERCAYCERRTGDDGQYDGHIEHFRDQCGNGHLGLDWANLFWSCNDERSCGKHKDKCRGAAGRRAKYEPESLLDPANDDPEDYLLFVSDGTVHPREGLDAERRRRAEETIRVFQLHESAFLRKSRQDAVAPYLGIVPTLLRLGPEIVVEYVKGELGKASAAPFSTAIKHFLESVIR